MSFPSSFEPIDVEIEEKVQFPSSFTPLNEQDPSPQKEQVPGYRSVIKGLGKAVTSLPTFRTGPISPSHAQKLLEKQFPTPETGLFPIVEGLTEGAGEGIKFGPVGAIAGGIGGALKEVAKQQGAPPWVQTMVDIAPWLFTKKGLVPKKNQKEAVELLRKNKFTDKEITPLLQGKTKLSIFGKIGRRGSRVEEILESISDKFKQAYEVFRELGKSKALPRKDVSNFVDKFESVWEDLPIDLRKQMKDIKIDFLGKPITRASMQDFFHAINRTPPGSRKILSRLKKPIYEGMEMVERGSGKEFELLNDLNVKKFEVMKKLAPSQIDRLASIFEFSSLIKSIAVGNFKAAAGVLGEVVARQMATEMVINPNLQNLSNKMMVSLAKNQLPIYKKLEKQFMEELKKAKPELYKKVSKQKDEDTGSPPKSI